MTLIFILKVIVIIVSLIIAIIISFWFLLRILRYPNQKCRLFNNVKKTQKCIYLGMNMKFSRIYAMYQGVGNLKVLCKKHIPFLS